MGKKELSCLLFAKRLKIYSFLRIHIKSLAKSIDMSWLYQKIIE